VIVFTYIISGIGLYRYKESQIMSTDSQQTSNNTFFFNSVLFKNSINFDRHV
jgi:hypothetical protein